MKGDSHWLMANKLDAFVDISVAEHLLQFVI